MEIEIKTPEPLKDGPDHSISVRLIHRKKIETQLVFMDFIIDQKDDLAVLFLKNPFMDYDKLG